MLVQKRPIATNRFYYPMDIGDCAIGDIDVRCEQINGHVGNDGKCINILNGQKGCQVLCPEPCCSVTRENLGKAPYWIQKILLAKEKIASMEWVTQLRNNEGTVGVSNFSIFEGTSFPARIPVIISRFNDSSLEPDPPTRVGKYSVANTYKD